MYSTMERTTTITAKLSRLMWLFIALFLLCARPGLAIENASYLVITNTGELKNERAISPGNNIFATDNGANSNYVQNIFNRAAQSSSPITLAATDATTQEITTGASTFTANLTACNGTNMSQKLFCIKKVDSGAGSIVVTPNATNSDKIDGATTYTLSTQYETLWIESDGGNPGNWRILGHYTTSGGGGMTNPMTTTGDLISSSPGSTPVRIADVAAGSYLRSGGISTLPLWSTLTLPNSCNQGEIIYGSASNTASMLAVGTSGQVLLTQGSGANPKYDWTGKLAIGGSGNDGTVTKGAVTETNSVDINAGTGGFTQSSSTTYSCAPSSTYKSLGTMTWSGTTNVQALFAGGNFNSGGTTNSGAGHGPNAGMGSGSSTIAGGGAGCLGAGGAGGSGSATAGAGGPAYASTCISRDLQSSSGGGSAGANGTAGGASPGNIYIEGQGAISIGASGSINATGFQGVDNTGVTSAAVGGGGSGGIIGIDSVTSIANSGTVSAAGGRGGNGGSGSGKGGGGGGGGGICFESPSNTAGTQTVTGGSAGTGSVAGTAGGNGVALNITDIPSLPTLALKYYGGGFLALARLHQAKELIGLEKSDIAFIEGGRHPTHQLYAAMHYKDPAGIAICMFCKTKSADLSMAALNEAWKCGGDFERLCYYINEAVDLNGSVHTCWREVSDYVPCNAA